VTVTGATSGQVVIASFQANPSNITAGQSSSLIWQTQNADLVTISGVGTVAQNGNTGVTPTQTTTYTLTASNKTSQASATATITVTAAQPTLPTVVSFVANPTQINAGGTSTLSWQVTNATSVSISGIGTVGLTGSQQVSPTATTTYTLTATNAAGQTVATATVTVVAAPTAATIVSFTAAPTTITAGQSSTLSWTTQNAVTAIISGIGSVAVNGSVQVSPTTTTVYTLTVTGSNGQAVTAQATVTVNPLIKPPIASAGSNFMVNVRQVPLNAGGSTDPQGLPLTYSWSTSSPGSSIVTPNSPTPFVQLGPENGDYTFTVTVTNSRGLSSTASVTITLIRTAPTLPAP
jgi:hypothetical protein